jgi:predicted methyltransferase
VTAPSVTAVVSPTMVSKRLGVLWISLVLASACGHEAEQPAATPTTATPTTVAQPAPIDATRAAALVAAPDRTDHDRERDKQRKPVDLLVFLGIAPGMHVADLGAGAGYTTELLARAVGPSGSVVAQDTPHWEDGGLQKLWDTRLARPALANTKHFMRGWNDPLPPDVKDLDLVTFVAAYHDVIAEKDDETKLAAAVFAALKHGGVFVVIDNSAAPNSGKTACQPLHRIDEAVVRDEVPRAGFKLVGESDFLRNPVDTRDWNADPGADPRTHTQDLFVLKFVKP